MGGMIMLGLAVTSIIVLYGALGAATITKRDALY